MIKALVIKDIVSSDGTKIRKGEIVNVELGNLPLRFFVHKVSVGKRYIIDVDKTYLKFVW